MLEQVAIPSTLLNRRTPGSGRVPDCELEGFSRSQAVDSQIIGETFEKVLEAMRRSFLTDIKLS